MSESKIDDGGPAFPHLQKTVSPHTGDHRWEITESYPGMTLRDWFAGQAMQALVSDPEWREQWVQGSWSAAHGNAAEIAYQYAEAMIAEKRKREEGK